jgi:hypothetical protein
MYCYYLAIIAILLLLLLWLNNNASVVESFEPLDGYCPVGYCPSDIKVVDKLSNQEDIAPKCPSAFKLGYNNPYIFPYNYDWNQNYPADKFKFPGWRRHMILESSNNNNFPGFAY